MARGPADWDRALTPGKAMTFDRCLSVIQLIVVAKIRLWPEKRKAGLGKTSSNRARRIIDNVIKIDS